MAAFDFTPYDLNERAQLEQAQKDYQEHLRAEGYRLEAKPKGPHTLETLAQATDQFAHNISIELREAIDRLGGRETEAGKTVANLWHFIVAHELEVHTAVKRLAFEAQVAEATVSK